jgi:hypothetical protein
MMTIHTNTYSWLLQARPRLRRVVGPVWLPRFGPALGWIRSVTRMRHHGAGGRRQRGPLSVSRIVDTWVGWRGISSALMTWTCGHAGLIG